MGHLTANNGSFPQQRATRVGVVSSKIAKIYGVHAGVSSSGALFFLRGGYTNKKTHFKSYVLASPVQLPATAMA